MRRQSISTEDYLKAVYLLCEQHGRATTTRLALHLSVKPASVTEMLQKLERQTPPLVNYRKRWGATLTDAGAVIALKTIRRHRLLEFFLVEKLGYQLHEVHAEAEVLEHAVSAEFVNRIDQLLGYPIVNPLGAPIPSRHLELPPVAWESIASAKPNEWRKVVRVMDDDATLLAECVSKQIVPGTAVLIDSSSLPTEACVIRTADAKTLILTPSQAKRVFVEPLS